jgi:pimeloyl-ACP methyl ester carboxylesterase
MDFLSELRHPTTWYSRLAIVILALGIFAILAVGSISGYSVYRMVSPARSRSEIDLQNFPGHPEVLKFNVSGEGPRDGWFFPGLKSAPTIVLCPAYQSSRGEVLTMASAMQDQQYNVLVFDFSGHGSANGRSTLGLKEVSELRAAMDAVANRGDVDASRFGLWGVSLGAYVALAEATADPRVRAIAAESPYNRPDDMVEIQIRRAGLGSIPLVISAAKAIFGWMNSPFRNVPPLNVRLNKLAGVAQLYLESPEDPALADSTTALFRISPAPHELVVLQHGNYAGMPDDEKRKYENRVVSFFLVNLPLASAN